MKKRLSVSLLTLLLALILLVSAACGNVETPAENTTDNAPAAQTTEGGGNESENPYDDQGYIKDSIPAGATCGGKTLRVLDWSDAPDVEFFVEDTAGETVQDSIFARNANVEDRLNVKFQYNGIPGNNNNRENFLSSAKNSAATGDNYDLYASYSMSTALLAYNGFCRDLNQFDVIDLSKPWWPDSLIKEANILNKLYFVSGDISTNLLYQMYAVFFNKNMIDSLNLELPYACVANNTWTFDTMFTMAKTAGSDPDAADRTFGFITASNVYVDPFFFAAGLRTLEPSKDGTLVISESFGSERAEDVASAVWDFLHDNCCDFNDSKYASFIGGNALFTMTTCNLAKNKLTDVGFTYGIVPVPKYTADLENYSTITGFGYTLYAVATSAENPAEAALALEGLASESYRTVTPALFYITMKLRYAQDSDSSKMFDIIRETVCFDTGRIFTSSFDKLTYNIFRNNVSADTKISYLASFSSNTRNLTRYVKALNDVFKDVKG